MRYEMWDVSGEQRRRGAEEQKGCEEMNELVFVYGKPHLSHHPGAVLREAEWVWDRVESIIF